MFSELTLPVALSHITLYVYRSDIACSFKLAGRCDNATGEVTLLVADRPVTKVADLEVAHF